ncbi:MAG: hypothetical protein H7A23_11180 [Leptospiraceae bacterium]|nr:hypothetical protein [Leptospiraceae bacterium]MCP5495107.1 hypothetical protein [Leptospiraceae bacterium]
MVENQSIRKKVKPDEIPEEQKKSSLSNKIFRFLWDFFMVAIVFVNIVLILFYLTYFMARSFYYEHIPEIPAYFEKTYLGIEPHRTTDFYLQYVDELKKIHELQNPENQKKEMNQIASKIEKQLEIISQTYKNEEFSKAKQIYSEVLKLEYEERNRTINFFIPQLNAYIDNVLKNEITDTYYELARDFQRYFQLNTEIGLEQEKQKILKKMDSQMILIIKENPFEASGQSAIYKKIQNFIKDKYRQIQTNKTDQEYKQIMYSNNPGEHIPSTTIAFTWFWRNPNVSIQEKFSIFDKELRPLLKLAYYRKIGLNGKPFDDFWKIDAPFFTFFLIEFLVRWFSSIRKKEYDAWFLFPMYNWYDVLGLIPFAEFRAFRLIRIYKMYRILRESEFTNVGDDAVSRTIKYYSDIIKEELSDMVTIQILTEAQDEIMSGSSMEIFSHAINKKRDRIKEVVISKINTTITGKRLEEKFKQILSDIVKQTSSHTFPTLFPEKFTTELGNRIFYTVTSAVGELVTNEFSKQKIEELIDFIIDEAMETAKDEEMNQLNAEITFELLENIKKQVKIKKWVTIKS